MILRHQKVKIAWLLGALACSRSPFLVAGELVFGFGIWITTLFEAGPQRFLSLMTLERRDGKKIWYQYHIVALLHEQTSSFEPKPQSTAPLYDNASVSADTTITPLQVFADAEPQLLKGRVWDMARPTKPGLANMEHEGQGPGTPRCPAFRTRKTFLVKHQKNISSPQLHNHKISQKQRRHNKQKRSPLAFHLKYFSYIHIPTADIAEGTNGFWPPLSSLSQWHGRHFIS